MATEPTLVGVGRTPEAAAAHGLYERHSRRVYGFCLQQLRSREEAEDATQSTFLNAFRALTRGVTPVAETAWLLSIAQNVCLTRLRSSVRRRRIEAPRDPQTLHDAVPAPPRGGFDELLRLEDALTELPATQRRAILLREWQGLTYREIAQELEMSQAAIETLIFRARQALAARLEESPRRKPARRLARWVDLGSAAGWFQGLLAGGTAKAVAAAAAVTAVTVTGGAPLRHDAPPPAQAAPKTARSAPIAPVATPPPPPRSIAFAAPVREVSRTRRPAARRAAPLLHDREGAPPGPAPAPAAPAAVPPPAEPDATPRPKRQAAAERAVERSEEKAARSAVREERKAVAAELRADRREQQDKPPRGQEDRDDNGRSEEKAAEKGATDPAPPTGSPQGDGKDRG
jgi:RNA polymerase sigma factor (sigma-70 family)